MFHHVVGLVSLLVRLLAVLIADETFAMLHVTLSRQD